MTAVAALYIDPRGPYPRMQTAEAFDTCEDEPHAVGWLTPRTDGLELDLWDAARDARTYEGPHPIIAHPPCKHWGRLRHLAHVECERGGWRGRESELIDGYCPECQEHWDDPAGECELTSDADCAPHAVEQVRRWGGVLEHPSGSLLWEHCGLPLPSDPHSYPRYIDNFEHPAGRGYTVEVDQCEWGHVARKRTWLYLVGVPREALEAPPFPGREPTHWVAGGHKSEGRKSKSTPVPTGIKICSAQQRRRTPPLFAEYLVRLARTARK